MNELDLQKAKGKSFAKHFTKAAAFHEKMADNNEKCAKAHGGAADCHEKMELMELAAGDDMKHFHKAKAAFHKTMESNHEKTAKMHKAYAEHNHAMGKMAELEGEDTKNKPSDEIKAAFSALGVEIGDTPVTKSDSTGDTMSTNDPVFVAPNKPATPATPAEPLAVSAAKTAAAAAFSGGEVSADEYQAALGKQFNEGMQAALKSGLAEALANPEFKKTVQETIGNLLLGELSKRSLAPTPVKTFAVPRSQEQAQQSIAQGVTPRLSGIENLDPSLADLISMGN